MFHWPLGWHCSYCAAKLVTWTSKRKQNIANEGMPHFVHGSKLSTFPSQANCSLESQRPCHSDLDLSVGKAWFNPYLHRLVQKKGTVLLSTSLAWPAVAGCSRAETFSQLSSISFAQPCILMRLSARNAYLCSLGRQLVIKVLQVGLYCSYHAAQASKGNF